MQAFRSAVPTGLQAVSSLDDSSLGPKFDTHQQRVKSVVGMGIPGILVRRHRSSQSLHRLLWLLGCLLLVTKALVALAQLSRGRIQFGQAVYTTSADFGVALVTVQRHLGSDGRAAIYVSTVPSGGGNAVLGRDFRPLFNQSLIWQDGDDLDRQLYVRILNDATPQETNKTFTLYLHDANGAELNEERNQTQIVLVPPTNLVSGSFRLLAAAVTMVESSSAVLEIPVLWESGTTSSARVAYQTRCESACSPDDFEVLSPPVLAWVRGGNTTQVIKIRVKDDGLFEQSESFVVALLPPRDLDPPPPDPVKDPSSVFELPPATLGNITEVRVTIQGPNNVNAGIAQFETACFPACPSNTYSVMDGGLVRAYVQRRNGTDGSLRARVVTLDGSARSGVDFKPVNQTIQWAEGDASTQFVLVETIGGVVRTATVQFTLVLVDVQGSSGSVVFSAPSSSVAATTTITIQGPSNIQLSDVNFILPSPLNPVLRFPDESFLSIVTRFDSGVRVCPRIVVRSPGDVTLYLRRNFGTLDHKAASVVVKTLDDSAVDGVDYVGVPAEGQVIAWTETDSRTTVKTLTIPIPAPPSYYTERRAFFVEITSVQDVALGLCHMVEVVLDGVSRPPRLTGFDLDMNQGTLTLQATHAVLANTLTPSFIQLQSDARPPASSVFEVFQLSAESTTASADGTTIVITLGVNDLNTLKRYKRLAKSRQTTFLGAAPGVFDYVLETCQARGFVACAHAKLEGVAATSALAVSTFTPDTTRPMLLGFTMDVGLGLVKLRFSEPVDSSTVRFASLGFSDTDNAADLRYLSPASSQVFRPNPNSLSGVLLFDGNPLPPDATYLTIQVGAADWAALRAVGDGQIGLQPTSTFLTMEADFVSDFASPPNAVVPVETPTLAAPALRLLRVGGADCSPCPAGTFLASSCSAMQSRVCQPCTVCPTNSYALVACTPLQDTTCYPCTECIGGRYTQSPCSPTSDRVCATCTACTSDEYEASPCANQADRVCRTCDSCTLTPEQQRLCDGSKRWRRRQMKKPYGCPVPGQAFQTLEARLQRSKSNRCGAGRCSCTGNVVGNANPNGESFPDDPRCTGPEVFGIDL